MSTKSSHATLAVVGHESLMTRGATWLRHAARVAASWHERAQQRGQLRSLDDRMLKDLGLSRADVDAEVAKPFWLP